MGNLIWRAISLVVFCLAVSGAAEARPRHGGAAVPLVLQQAPYMGTNVYWYLGSGGTLGVTEANMHDVANFMLTSGLVAAGYNFMTLDAGWWDGSRDGAGNIPSVTAQWPSGMPALAGYIHSKGMRAGIYTDVGTHGCPATSAGSGGHFAQDIASFVNWGFDASKWDMCGIDASDPLTVYSTIAGLIPATMQYFLSTYGYGHEAWGYAQASWPFTAWRFAMDSNLSIPVNWGQITTILYANFHPGVARVARFNDSDCMYPTAGFGLTDTEAQAQMVVWAVLTSPLLICSDPRSLTSTELTFLKNAEVIAVDQDPLFVQGWRVKGAPGAAQVFSKPVFPGPGMRAVAMLNDTGSSTTISFTAADVGLQGTFTARDLIAHAPLGSMASYSTTVASHEAKMLLLTGGLEAAAVTYKIAAGATGTIGSFAADTTLPNFPADGHIANTATTIDLSAVASNSPAPMAVYQNVRYGNGSPVNNNGGANLPPSNSRFVEFFFPVQVGRLYKVRLHFAEISAIAAGQRFFNVWINTHQVLTNFDIVATAGAAYKANIQEFMVPAPAGFVSVDIGPSLGSPNSAMISGIEVIPQ